MTSSKRTSCITYMRLNCFSLLILTREYPNTCIDTLKYISIKDLCKFHLVQKTKYVHKPPVKLFLQYSTISFTYSRLVKIHLENLDIEYCFESSSMQYLINSGSEKDSIICFWWFDLFLKLSHNHYWGSENYQNKCFSMRSSSGINFTSDAFFRMVSIQ